MNTGGWYNFGYDLGSRCLPNDDLDVIKLDSYEPTSYTLSHAKTEIPKIVNILIFVHVSLYSKLFISKL